MMSPQPPPGYMLDPKDPSRAIPVASAAPSRPMFQEVKTANPQTPEERAATVASTNKTNKEAANIVTPHVLTADEVAANPTLDPGKAWAMAADGNIKPIGDVPQPFKIGDADAINHAYSVIDSINNARTDAGKPLATGTLSATVASIPLVGGLVGQNRANLQTKLGQVAGDLRQLGIQNLYQATGKKGVGSVARNQSEQQALQSSLAPLGFVDQGGHVVATGPQPDAATLGQGLDAAQNIYVRHLARLYGMNPDDPKSAQLIGAAIADPARRAQLLGASPQGTPATGQPQPGDNGITESNALPPLRGLDSEGVSSGDTKVVTDPKLAAIAPQLTAYLNADPKKVSNAMILGFMQKNGVDPVGTNLMPLLQMRSTGKYKGFTVDPRMNVPLTGGEKVRAEVSASAPAAAVAGAADTATLGAIPDTAGVINSITGLGPNRAEAVQARDAIAANSPVASFAGNMIGGVASPFARGGGILRSAGLGGLYGFLGSDDPALQSRLLSAGIGGTVGAAAHGATALAANGGASGYRAVSSPIRSLLGDPEAVATQGALARTANQMPTQDVDAATARLMSLKANGANPPAAAALSRSGQDYLARMTAGSPGARAVADDAATSFRQAIPQQLAGDFDEAIHDAATSFHAANGHTAEFLQRPSREIARDVQDMAGREYETGIAPISRETLAITPELADTLTHERIGPAIRDALANQKLDPDTRQVLRNLPGQLKALDTSLITPAAGMDPEKVAALQAQVRAKYAEHIPLSVDAGRNIATALDRTAAKLQDGTEAAVNLHQLSGEIRNAIGEQYPEYQAVNARYSGRMRAIEALDDARRHFLGESPDQIDALAKASRKFTDTPGEPEYGTLSGTEPVGKVQPSNRQFALAGAREAVTVKAGSGTGEGGGKVARQLAEGPNQQQRTAMVAGDEAAAKLAPKAAAKADVADALDRVASGASADQADRWWQLGKRVIAAKVTGGTAHYAAAHALAGMPGMSGDDAARVMRVYLDANSSDQALKSLSQAYGARRARFIMARMASVASAASVSKGSPARQPEPAQ